MGVIESDHLRVPGRRCREAPADAEAKAAATEVVGIVV